MRTMNMKKKRSFNGSYFFSFSWHFISSFSQISFEISLKLGKNRLVHHLICQWPAWLPRNRFESMSQFHTEITLNCRNCEYSHGFPMNRKIDNSVRIEYLMFENAKKSKKKKNYFLFSRVHLRIVRFDTKHSLHNTIRVFAHHIAVVDVSFYQLIPCQITRGQSNQK